jgi:hypothetical protein
MSRFSLIPEEFTKTDLAMAQAEAREEADPAGQPRVRIMKINWETPYLDRLHAALCKHGSRSNPIQGEAGDRIYRGKGK